MARLRRRSGLDKKLTVTDEIAEIATKSSRCLIVHVRYQENPKDVNVLRIFGTEANCKIDLQGTKADNILSSSTSTNGDGGCLFYGSEMTAGSSDKFLLFRKQW